MENKTHKIHVCYECESSQAIAETLKRSYGDDFHICMTKCMGQCDNPCNLALTAQGKMSCLLVGITPDNVTEIKEALNMYKNHKVGHIHFKKLSPENQKRYVARLPVSS